MNKEIVNTLLQKAIAARETAYCPYSGFAVGAALQSEDGQIFTGANIESATHTPTVCAERVAMFSAVHAGVRRFRAIAVVGGKADEPISQLCPPCGVCRQVLAEFCDPDFCIILSDGTQSQVLTLHDLLPLSFSKSNLD